MRMFQIFKIALVLVFCLSISQCDPILSKSDQWSHFYPGLTPQDMTVSEDSYAVAGFELCHARTMKLDSRGNIEWKYPVELQFNCEVTSSASEVALLSDGFGVLGYARTAIQYQLQVQHLSKDGDLISQGRFGNFSGMPFILDSLVSNDDLWYVGESESSAFFGLHSLTENQNSELPFDAMRASGIQQVGDEFIISAQSSLDKIENYTYQPGDQTPELQFQHFLSAEVEIVSTVFLPDGDFVVMGRVKDSSESVTYLAWFNSEGEQVWFQSYEIYGVKMLYEGFIVLLGTETKSDSQGNLQLVIFETDLGLPANVYPIYREGSDRAVDFHPTADDGWIITSSSVVDGVNGTWVLKMNKYFLYPEEITFKN